MKPPRTVTHPVDKAIRKLEAARELAISKRFERALQEDLKRAREDAVIASQIPNHPW